MTIIEPRRPNGRSAVGSSDDPLRRIAEAKDWATWRKQVLDLMPPGPLSSAVKAAILALPKTKRFIGEGYKVENVFAERMIDDVELRPSPALPAAQAASPTRLFSSIMPRHVVDLGPDAFHAVMMEIERGEARIVLDGGPLEPETAEPASCPSELRADDVEITTDKPKPNGGNHQDAAPVDPFAGKPRRSPTIRVPGAHGGMISMT
jgi:hypothetical protein